MISFKEAAIRVIAQMRSDLSKQGPHTLDTFDLLVSFGQLLSFASRGVQNDPKASKCFELAASNVLRHVAFSVDMDPETFSQKVEEAKGVLDTAMKIAEKLSQGA